MVLEPSCDFEGKISDILGKMFKHWAYFYIDISYIYKNCIKKSKNNKEVCYFYLNLETDS